MLNILTYFWHTLRGKKTTIAAILLTTATIGSPVAIATWNYDPARLQKIHKDTRMADPD